MNADLGYVVLTLTLHFSAKALAGGAMCKDINGSSIETGRLYIPGPKPCTICVCENGNPTFCKAVLCKYKDQESLPNKDCKTFRFGNNCCELICLDETLSTSTNDKTDTDRLQLQLVGLFVITLLSIILIAVCIRSRQNKIRAGQQNNQLSDDQRSLGSMGYLDRNSLQHGMPMDDLPSSGYPLWKPPSNYFPRGEAPPPYEEAVAAARAEQGILLFDTQHSLVPLSGFTNYLIEQNSHRNVSIVSNSQNGLPASSPTLSQNNAPNTSPAISVNNRPLSSPAAHSCYHLNQTTSTTPDFCAGTCTSLAISTNTYENLPTVGNRSTLSNSVSSISPQHIVSSSNQLLPTSSQNPSVQNFRQHTTLPRQGGAFTISATLSNSQAEVHRTIPRTSATSGSLRLRREYSMHQSVAPLFDKPLISPKNTVGDEERSPRAASATDTPSRVPLPFTTGDAAVRTNAFFENSSCSRESPSTPAKVLDTKSTDKSTTLCNYKPPLAAANEVNEEGSFDSVTCTCNAQVLPPLHDDTDDYRSECENCKSSNGSRYYLDNEDELVTSPHETMTLQRRPEDTTSSTTPQYYKTSLTLPTNTRSRTRSTSSRGNWFSSMPESSTESSDGD